MEDNEWQAFINIGDLSDDSQPNAFVQSFEKTQRGKINTVIKQDNQTFVYNMISGNMRKKTITLRCCHVKSGCQAKSKGKILNKNSISSYLYSILAGWCPFT